ncbi:DUF4287 domain-containing protein [Variovorax sp. J22R24]|uniref:DUF4287 domain-containing protein n=1 Tax=Variovorax gracilis TaxID=3053502 RepID=UPI002574B5FA|nr:DUF4287 domain-containing protein [Variovorax sp. J22R24]MDM0109727.1 DUF4287 domain-containing protein [Variovorax sp. J22R24]
MTFEAYMNHIRGKTGKEPKDFFDQAVQAGILRPDTRTMEFVAWLKSNSGLGHGHAMAVWEAFKRNGWVPLPSAPAVAAKRGRP